MWERSLKLTQKSLAKMTDEFQLLLEQQEGLLAKVLNPARLIKKPVVLKKLPLWGEKVMDDEIDF